MARYEHITRYIEEFESASSDAELRRIYREFLNACYTPTALDPNYAETLERYGLWRGGQRYMNIESLEIEAAVALLVLLDRSVRGMFDVDPNAKPPLLRAIEDGYGLRLLRRIAELDGTWVRPNVVTFYHEYEKDGYLSNWYESSFEFRRTKFPTSEHWMMWQKAQVFGDSDIAGKILQVSDQGTAKHLGKQVHGYSDEVWDAVNQQLMRVGLRYKFVQNERLFNDLLSTGSAVLGEAAGSKDAKWGVGFAKGNPKLEDPANWYGQNLLGRTLMDVRSDLRSLCGVGGGLKWWSLDDLVRSHVWNMNLLELARVPSTRSVALMYATIVARHAPEHYHDARDVLRKQRASIGEINWSSHPEAGWNELLDELAFQVRIGRI